MPRREWPAWAKLSDILDLLRLSAPIAVSRAAFLMMLLTDTIILGRNAAEEVPFVMIAWFPISITVGVSMGLLLGVSVLTAELAGKGKAARSGRVFRRGLFIASACGLVGALTIFFVADPLFILLGFEGAFHEGVRDVARILAFAMLANILNAAITFYLEALRRPLLVSVTMYVGVGINLVFDLLFVSGMWGMPAMGARGVAIATTGTNICLFLVFIAMAFFLTPAFRSSGQSPDGEARRQVKVGLGMAVSNAAEFGSFNYTHVMAGWIAISAATVYGMVFQVIAAAFMLFLGLGTATNVRVAERFGRGDVPGVVNASRLGVVTCLLVGALAALLITVFKSEIASVFLRTDEVIDGVRVHPVLAGLVGFAAFMLVFDGLQNVAALASRARGLSWLPTSVYLGSYTFVMLPLAYLFGIIWSRGVQGIMEAILVASILAAVSQIVILEVFAKKSDLITDP